MRHLIEYLYDGNRVSSIRDYDGTTKMVGNHSFSYSLESMGNRIVLVHDLISDMLIENHVDSLGRIAMTYKREGNRLFTMGREEDSVVQPSSTLSVDSTLINGQGVYSCSPDSHMAWIPASRVIRGIITLHVRLIQDAVGTTFHLCWNGKDRISTLSGTSGIWQKVSSCIGFVAGNNDIGLFVTDAKGNKVPFEFSDIRNVANETDEVTVLVSSSGFEGDLNERCFYLKDRNNGQRVCPLTTESIISMWRMWLEGRDFHAIYPDGTPLPLDCRHLDICHANFPDVDFTSFLAGIEHFSVKESPVPSNHPASHLRKLRNLSFTETTTSQGVVERHPTVTEVIQTENAQVRTTRREYDRFGRILSEQVDGRSTIVHSYDDVSRIHLVSVQGTEIGRQELYQDGTPWKERRNGVTTEFLYSDGLLSSIRTTAGNQALAVRTFSHDGLNSRIKETTFGTEATNTVLTLSGEVSDCSDSLRGLSFTRNHDRGLISCDMRQVTVLRNPASLFVYDSEYDVAAERKSCSTKINGCSDLESYDVYGRPLLMTHSTMSDDFHYGTDFDADFCVKRVTKVIHSSGSSYLGVTEYTYDGNDFSRMEKTTMGNHIFRKKIGDTIGYGLYNHTGYVGDIEKGYLKLSGMVDGCKWRTSASGQFMDFKLFYEAKLGRLALLKGPQWQQSFSYAEGNLSSVPDSMSFNGFSAFPFGTSVVQQNTSDAFGRMRNAQVGIYEYKNNGSEHSLVFGGIGVDYDPHGRISSSDAFSAGETLESRIYRYSGGCMIGYYDDWMEREVSFTRDCFGRVTSFDSEDGENIITIGYDQYGRRSFESGSLGTRSYTYMGRLLMSAVVGDITTSFSYGAFGLRSMKVTGSETIRYYYSDGRLLFTLSQNGDACSFLYDSLGPCAMVMDMVTYTLIRDTMGDIIAILDDEGRLLVRYDYDAWGRIVRKTMKHDSDYGIHDDVDHVADLAKKADRRCPFRYRGYVYDGETGLYYLGSRYYDPRTFLFLTMDEFASADASVISGLDLYCYCNYDPVNYSDGSGHFAVLAILCGIAAVGLGLTIGGVASDNNAMTGIGLSMVAVPALISGGLAIAAGIGGATLTGVVGGITVAAGLGTATFATAEYQEAFTGDNWILDAGMSEGWYNGLMLTTATIATLGTFASSIGYSFRIKSITEIGSIDGTQYKGIKFEQVSPNGNVRLRSLEWHTHLHNGHYHWQLNKWDGLIRKGTAGRWTWWLGRL